MRALSRRFAPPYAPSLLSMSLLGVSLVASAAGRLITPGRAVRSWRCVSRVLSVFPVSSSCLSLEVCKLLGWKRESRVDRSPCRAAVTFASWLVPYASQFAAQVLSFRASASV